MQDCDREQPVTKPFSPAQLWAELDLTDADREAIRRQGFISSERRGSNTTVFKLRFRVAGRQQVRYLGTDPERAAQLQAWLDDYQKRRQLRRQLAARIAAAKALLASIKPRLSGTAAEAGYVFHGRALRRPHPAADRPSSSKHGDAP